MAVTVNGTKRSFEELNDNDEFVTLYCNIFANRNICNEQKQKRWDSLSEGRKNTPTVALAAMKADILSVFELPESVLSNKKFMLQVATLRDNAWDNLVPKFKSDPEFAHAILEYTQLRNARLVKESLKACPSLRSEATFWIQFANSSGSSKQPIYNEFFPKSLLSNKDVVLALFARTLLGRFLIDDAFFRDATFITRFLDAAAKRYELLDYANDPLLENNKGEILAGLVKNLGSQVVDRYDGHKRINFIRDLGDTISNDFRFKEAWIAASGGKFMDGVPDSWFADKSVLLLVAKHHTPFRCCTDLKSKSRFDVALLADKKLMCRVCSLDSDFYHACDPSIRDNNNVRMCTLSERRILHSIVMKIVGNVSGSERLRSRWKQQKQARIAIDKVILPAMHISGKTGTEPHALYILNQGDHNVKHLIAEYLDYPFGNPLTLQSMQRAIDAASVAIESE